MARLVSVLFALAILTTAAGPAAAPADGASRPAAAGAALLRGVWPTGAAVPVVRAFDPPPRPWLAGHRGADLLVWPGQTIASPVAGTVALASFIVDRPVLVVQSGSMRISLEPVTALVPVGTTVAAGDPIGVIAVGHSHCLPRHCLHWGLRIDGRYHDPLLLVRRYRAVLLPEAAAG